VDQCPSCHPTIIVKALYGTQRTNPDQWPGLIRSSSTTKLLKKGPFLHLNWLPEASIKIFAINFGENIRCISKTT